MFFVHIIKRKRLRAVLMCILICAASSVFTSSASPLQKIPVLVYHSVLFDDEIANKKAGTYIIAVDAFEQQMKYLSDNNYHALTPNDLIDFIYNDKNLPSNSVFIQFDDGYYNNITHAYPILKKYCLRATIFDISNTAVPSQAPLHPDGISFISKDDMQATTDVFTFASHTHDLHGYEGENTRFSLASRNEILDDLRKSFEIVGNHTVFAYPYGQFNEGTTKALMEAGVRLAFTVNPGYVTRGSDPYNLSRFTVYNNTSFSLFESFVKGEVKYR
ncbi:MAG: polysaccharide deacetylase family protein [Oscillospiraceae bacterium]|jgi:peptidoglycan/xylan/chitin deacetylase (PgdA/CDA1 family)|nr:polysaccharide deacetylase family protein [Oscillospiraceae bacterium]